MAQTPSWLLMQTTISARIALHYCRIWLRLILCRRMHDALHQPEISDQPFCALRAIKEGAKQLYYRRPEIHRVHDDRKFLNKIFPPNVRRLEHLVGISVRDWRVSKDIQS